MAKLTISEEQARALGSPTRAEIMRFVAARAPVTVAAIAAHLEVDESAVRRHVAELVRADLLVERVDRSRRGRGRPPRTYVLGGESQQFTPLSAYERLASMLAEVAEHGDDPVEVGRRTARTGARRRRVLPIDAIVDELTAQGFAPEVDDRADHTAVVLHRCPFASVATRAPDTVCALHLGLLEGTLDAMHASTVAVSLHPKDPRRAGCRVTLSESRET